MDDVIRSEDSFVAGREDDTAGDQVNEVDVDEALGRSIFALRQNETQIWIYVFEKHGPIEKVKNNHQTNFTVQWNAEIRTFGERRKFSCLNLI